MFLRESLTGKWIVSFVVIKQRIIKTRGYVIYRIKTLNINKGRNKPKVC